MLPFTEAMDELVSLASLMGCMSNSPESGRKLSLPGLSVGTDGREGYGGQVGGYCIGEAWENFAARQCDSR